MTTDCRTPAGGRVDRANPLSFSFDGRRLAGFQGDTLASALLAHGIHLVGRSFKYHRPRGILGAGADEPNALVGVRRDQTRYTPNLLATQIELYEGLEAISQNRHPSLENDRLAVTDKLFSRLVPAGFYYKTFLWPRKAWKNFYEPRIRRAAGLGVAPLEADPDSYTQRYAHTDVLVIGAGPAGLAAAIEAGQAGARVILCDQDSVMGGSLLCSTDVSIDGKPASDWLEAAMAQLGGLPNVTLLPRTVAFGFYPHNWIGLAERLTDHLSQPPSDQPRERLWQIRARQVVIATGAIERPLVFPDNDRPGIMLAEAARTYLKRYGVKVGHKIVMIAAHDSGYRAAFDLQAAGVEVVAIADTRSRPALAEDARIAGIRTLTEVKVEGTKGSLRVSSVTLAAAEGRHTLACDALLMAGGFTPSVHLHSQARGQLDWDPEINAYVPGLSAEAERSAGACRGRFELADALADGMEAGRAAAERAGAKPETTAQRPSVASRNMLGSGGHIGAMQQVSGRKLGKAFVDWQNDVTVADLQLATREGFVSIEHIKRYTTTGMATDQGKLSNINALGIVARETERPIPQIGLTTFRPPYTPLTFGTLAGRARGDLFEPKRVTPIHGWAEERGAVFEDVAGWRRARYFPNAGEDLEAAIARESCSVRASVGLFDASTLGKIEVVGPDAAEFMNRVYINGWSKLPVGHCRYGVLLREDGFVLDDGVVGRLGSDRFHVTTTTGGASRVLAMMEDYLQTEWPELKVWLTSITEQWSVIAVQGPMSRAVLEPLVEGIDISADAFPHMSISEGTICGVPLRLMRVSFTGELGFEVNVPSGHSAMIWEAIWQNGKAHRMVPYGTETMHLLRAEKGYIIVGQETDGTATPDDLGLSWAVGKMKSDFIGKRSLARPAMSAPDRKQLVGITTENTAFVLEEGAQVVSEGGSHISEGHVTSSYFSSVLNRSIALAMVRRGRDRIGERVLVQSPQGLIAARVASPVFFDPEGKRING